MLKILRNIIMNRPKKNSNLLLGRWNLKNNQNISATLANMDSCGDRLCGDINLVRDAIKNYINKK